MDKSWLYAIGKGSTAWPLAILIIAVALLLAWIRG